MFRLERTKKTKQIIPLVSFLKKPLKNVLYKNERVNQEQGRMGFRRQEIQHRLKVSKGNTGQWPQGDNCKTVNCQTGRVRALRGRSWACWGLSQLCPLLPWQLFNLMKLTDHVSHQNKGVPWERRLEIQEKS